MSNALSVGLKGVRLSPILVCFFILCFVLSSLFIPSFISVRASPGAEVRVINPLTGTNLFNFTSSSKSVGDAFIVNITIADVINMVAWQIKFGWDPALLDFVNITIPSDHVFAGRTTIIPPPLVETGNVTYGVALFPSTQPSFNGSGRLCQIALKTTKAVNHQSSSVSCTLSLANADTFLLDPLNHDILFTPRDGYYEYSWIPPSYNPEIFLAPNVFRPIELGDIFPIEVWLKDVSPDWLIIGAEFSLTWNTTFIKPALGPGGHYYDPGTFFEAYQYNANGVSYSASINLHEHSPTPLPDGYNYSTFKVTLLPDSPPLPAYHSPFPSGQGKVLTMYFEAIYETIYPQQDSTTIAFIGEDTHAIDQFNLEVSVSSSSTCLYIAPIRILTQVRDVAITSMNSSFLAAGQGKRVDVDVRVENLGTTAEQFNLTLYANQSTIETIQNVELENASWAANTFHWNTTEYAVGNYTLWAYIEPLLNETNVENNNFTMPGQVFITFLGDVTGSEGVPDGKVDMRDIGAICNHFGFAPIHPLWDPTMDLNDDNTINMRDIGIACANFGKHI